MPKITLENMTVSQSTTSKEYRRQINLQAVALALLMKRITNSMRTSPSMACPLGHPNSVQHVHYSICTPEAAIQYGLACWQAIFSRESRKDKKINQTRKANISNFRQENRQNPIMYPAHTNGLKMFEIRFMNQIKASVELACNFGTCSKSSLQRGSQDVEFTTIPVITTAVPVNSSTIRRILSFSPISILYT